MRRKIIPPIDLTDFKILDEETDDIYLSIPEIRSLYNLNLSCHPHLGRFRDLFVLGCLTGLRFSDYSIIKPEDIRKGMLYKKQGKSDHWVVIPLRPEAHEILIKYKRKMNGFKPPNTTRVCIQPGYYNIWDRTWKNGSIVSIACEFIRDKYESLDKHGRYRYILDIIQAAMIQLRNEYNWDKLIFEKAYQDVLDCDFLFKIDFPKKTSRDKKKAAHLSVEKTETITSAFALIENGSSSFKVKLFDKKNSWWYDCVYLLAKHAKWRDSNSFGIFYPKGGIEIYFSINEDRVFLFDAGLEVQHINFRKIFRFQ